jgi:hypothetical protein
MTHDADDEDKANIDVVFGVVLPGARLVSSGRGGVDADPDPFSRWVEPDPIAANPLVVVSDGRCHTGGDCEGGAA